ncbi:MAG: hypothetical protein HOP21_01070 [Methylotenera sp.]|nr:hypothetical protein [Methylotenera sp.]
MNLLFILDPLEHLKSEKDTSLAIMREAAGRGHGLYIAMQHDLFLRGATAKVMAQQFTFTAQAYTLGEAKEYAPAEFDAIIMRKDPPFDNEYLSTARICWKSPPIKARGCITTLWRFAAGMKSFPSRAFRNLQLIGYGLTIMKVPTWHWVA